MNSHTNTPIAFIVFNRPDVTATVFEAIRKARPTTLLLIADGPRAHKQGEVEKCEAVRRIVMNIDWECDVRTRFQESNLGCKRNVSSGISWVFEQVESAIILEDDCLPQPSFFRFCDELLERYKDDERIMQISGTNLQFGRMRGDASYYFSKYNSIWGWATWRRAWQKYDVDMKTFPDFMRLGQLQNILRDPQIQKKWQTDFQAMFEQKIDTWDYQWVYTMWSQRGMAVVPNTNLVTNLGFGADATHTTNADSLLNSMQSNEIDFPLRHPHFFCVDEQADSFVEFTMMQTRLKDRIVNKVRRLTGLR